MTSNDIKYSKYIIYQNDYKTLLEARLASL